MPDEPEPVKQDTGGKEEPEPPAEKVKEEDVGDFITRHVLEKDSVFFEG